MTAGQGKKQRCTKVQSRAPHREEIKAAIRMRGVTMTDLSHAWGYSESAIRVALHAPYPKLEALIAEFLGVKPAHLWPDRYDAKGNTLHPGPGGHRK